MTKPLQHLTLTTAAIAAAACGAEADHSRPDWSLNPSLTQAHEALLDRNYAAVTKAAEQAYRDDRLADFEAENLQSLLNAAYAETAGRLPSDWTLPSMVEEVIVEQLLEGRPDQSPEYELRLLVKTKGARDLVRAELIRSPNRSTLDSRRERYEVESEADGHLHWVIQARQARATPAGLYLIRLTLASGEVSEGAVVLQDLESSATPKVEAIGEVADGRPWLRFRLPSLPERRDFERASLVAYVGTWKATREPAWKTEWLMATPNLDLNAIQLGDPALGEGTESLAPGRYQAGVTLRMERSFGPVTVRRLVRTPQSLVVR